MGRDRDRAEDLLVIRDRILIALAGRDMTAADLAAAVGTTYRTLYSGRNLAHLKAECLIHICAWTRNLGDNAGRSTPVFRLGSGENVPKPEPIPQSVRAMRWQQKYPERYKASRDRAKYNASQRVEEPPVIERPHAVKIDPIFAALSGVRQ